VRRSAPLIIPVGLRSLTVSQMNIIVTSPSSSTKSHHETRSPPLSPEQFKPGDIAISLSLIEGDHYSKITQADYIAHLRGTSITNHIESATKINNRLVNWVKTKILRSGSVCVGGRLFESC